MDKVWGWYPLVTQVFVKSINVGSGNNLLLLVFSATHHNRGTQKEDKRIAKKIVLCNIIIAALVWEQRGEKEGTVQGLLTKTKWKGKPYNQITWTAIWSWIWLHKLHVNEPKSLSEVVLLLSCLCEHLPSHSTSLGSVSTVLLAKVSSIPMVTCHLDRAGKTQLSDSLNSCRRQMPYFIVSLAMSYIYTSVCQTVWSFKATNTGNICATLGAHYWCHQRSFHFELLSDDSV